MKTREMNTNFEYAEQVWRVFARPGNVLCQRSPRPAIWHTYKLSYWEMRLATLDSYLYLTTTPAFSLNRFVIGWELVTWCEWRLVIGWYRCLHLDSSVNYFTVYYNDNPDQRLHNVGTVNGFKWVFDLCLTDELLLAVKTNQGHQLGILKSITCTIQRV